MIAGLAANVLNQRSESTYDSGIAKLARQKRNS
jgi:hypothetical protein